MDLPETGTADEPGTSTVPRIVVGVDDSEYSRRALRWAAHLGRRLGAVLDVVHAWEMRPWLGMTPGMAQFTWDPQVSAEKGLVAVVDEVFGADRPIGTILAAVEGRPATVLVERSDGALLLVVGRRGRGGVAATLLGSVSAPCVRLAHCPVLVVHDEDPPGDASGDVSGERP